MLVLTQETKTRKKHVEGILHELSNEDKKFACTGSPGGTGKEMPVGLQGSGLAPAEFGDKNPTLWTA